MFHALFLSHSVGKVKYFLRTLKISGTNGTFSSLTIVTMRPLVSLYAFIYQNVLFVFIFNFLVRQKAYHTNSRKSS